MRIRLPVAFAASLLASTAFGGPAQDFAEALKKDLLARGFSSMTYESASEDGAVLVIKGLKVAEDAKAEKVVELGEWRLNGTVNGTLLANVEVKAVNVRQQFPHQTMLSPTLEAKGLSGPAAAYLEMQFSYDALSASEQTIKALGELSATTISIPSLSLDSHMPNVDETKGSYSNLVITDIANGRYGTFTLGPATFTSGKSTLSFEKAEARNIDTLAVMRISAQDQLVGEYASVSNLAIKDENDRAVKIGSIVMDRLAFGPGDGSMLQSMRRFVTPKPSEDEDETAKEKRERGLALAAVEYMQRIKVQRIALRDIVMLEEEHTNTIGAIMVNNYSGMGFESLVMEQLNLGTEESPFVAKTMRIDGIDYSGAFRAIKDFAATQEPAEGLINRLLSYGAFKLKGFAIEEIETTDNDQNPLKMAAVRAGFGEFIGSIPSRMQISINKLEGVVEPGSEGAKAFGSNIFTADLMTDIAYDAEKKTLHLSESSLDVPNAGRINMTAMFGNIERATLENIHKRYMDFVTDPQFIHVSVQANNNGLVERAFAEKARKQKQKLPQFKAKMKADMAKEVKKSIKDKAIADPLIASINAFIDNPRSLRAIVTPKEEPMPMMALALALNAIREKSRAFGESFNLRFEANQ